MKQAQKAVPYMAISSESLLSAVMDMEGTQKCQRHRCSYKRFLCLLCIPWEKNISVSFVYIRGQKVFVFRPSFFKQPEGRLTPYQRHSHRHGPPSFVFRLS